jgi:ribonuclease P protein component
LVGRNNLPRSLSLKSRVEISHLLEKGRRFPTDFFTLIWLPADSFRYGVFLSRRHGPAHQRVRLKRLFREAIRLSRKGLAKTGRVAILPRIKNSEPQLDRLIAQVSNIFERISREK